MTDDHIPAEPPAAMLAALDKDSRLTPYGGGNFGTPPALLADVDGLIVPTERFFMRSNGPVPKLDVGAWRLTIGGHVERPLTLTYDDLRQFSARQLMATLECAGNSRTRFDPIPEGTAWRNDAVGNAVWEGTSLATLLDRAGVKDGAVDVVSQGGDFPEMARGLPIATARDPETMVVWAMNGEPLPIAHGGPVRLFVPGWAGIASTKWLIGIEVLDRAFAGFWNTSNYVMLTEAGEAVRPVREMPVKSVIITPGDGATIERGEQEITGFAWSGNGPVERVEISTDGGGTWTEAKLERGLGRWSWVRFRHRWTAEPGQARIQARATDERQLTQPATVPWNAKGYEMNAIQTVVVTVE